MITVYLANNIIQVAVGNAGNRRVGVNGLYATIDSAGCLTNGTVTDAEAFVELMSGFWSANKLPKKNVTLVINSTQFITKLMKVPSNLNTAKTLSFISNEFSDVERMTDPIYSYYVLSEDKASKLRTIVATMVERGFVAGHVETFAQMGIKVSGIETSLGSAIRLINRLPEMRRSTSIVQILDDVNLTSILFVDGDYTYSSRSRLFSDKGTSAFADEIARSVSGIEQFVQANGIETPITDVFLNGIAESDRAFCENSISALNYNVNISTLDADKRVKLSSKATQSGSFNEYLYPIAGLIVTEAKLNLFGRAKADPSKKESKAKLRKVLKPLIWAAVIAMLLFGTLFGLTRYYQSLLDEVLAYNTREDVVADCALYDKLSAETEQIQKVFDGSELTKLFLDSYPLGTTEVRDQIEDCTEGLAVEVNFTGFSSIDGLISFNSIAKDVKLINEFVDQLKKEDFVLRVDYTGYSYNDSSRAWTVNLVCYLAENAGRADDTDVSEGAASNSRVFAETTKNTPEEVSAE